MTTPGEPGTSAHSRCLGAFVDAIRVGPGGRRRFGVRRRTVILETLSKLTDRMPQLSAQRAETADAENQDDDREEDQEFGDAKVHARIPFEWSGFVWGGARRTRTTLRRQAGRWLPARLETP